MENTKKFFETITLVHEQLKNIKEGDALTIKSGKDPVRQRALQAVMQELQIELRSKENSSYPFVGVIKSVVEIPGLNDYVITTKAYSKVLNLD